MLNCGFYKRFDLNCKGWPNCVCASFILKHFMLYICSVLSRNLRFLEIPRKPAILKNGMLSKAQCLLQKTQSTKSTRNLRFLWQTVCKISDVRPVFGHFPAVSSDKPLFLSLQNANGPIISQVGWSQPSFNTHGIVTCHWLKGGDLSIGQSTAS